MKKISLLLGVLFFSFFIGCKSIDELDVKPTDGLVKSGKPFVLDTNSVHLKPNSMETLKQLEVMLKRNMKNNKNAKKADFDGYGLGKLFWQAGFSSEQNEWFNTIASFGYDSENIKQKLWDDVYNVRNFLDMFGMDRNPDITSPYFSLSLALLSAAHAQSIGDNLTGGWVYESYKNKYDNETLNQIVFNDFIGRTVATNSYNQNNQFYLLLDVVWESWVNGNREVPGGKRIGFYQDVPVFASPFSGGSVTFPGNSRGLGKIYLQPGTHEDLDEMRHEFGHILQGEDLGLLCFYTEIAINSTRSARKDGQNGYRHQCYYTETDANDRSKTYHQNSGALQNFPWNNLSFPPLCLDQPQRIPCN